MQLGTFFSIVFVLLCFVVCYFFCCFVLVCFLCVSLVFLLFRSQNSLFCTLTVSVRLFRVRKPLKCRSCGGELTDIVKVIFNIRIIIVIVIVIGIVIIIAKVVVIVIE